ncbi:MAG: three-Cys-motif partner protein TcmP [Terracidiphilus sp.]|jgi:three-Cys-motif partner protein
MNDEYSEREQSGLKHFALRKYLEAATRIIGSSWNRFSYVDCCAGPWESRSPDFADTSFGIAVEVLKESKDALRNRGITPKFRALLIEEKPEPFNQLAAFASRADDKDIQVRAQNWDFREHTSEIVQFVANPPSFSFIFVDPTGWTPAEIGGLGPLLRIKPGEVLINFMSSFIVRFLNDEATNMNEILGPDYREIRTLSHEDREDEAVRRYCELIRRQGDFRYVCALPVMKPDQDAIHFHLIYGTRNAKGVEVFKQVEKQTEAKTRLVRAELQQNKRPNLDLFSSDVLYKRAERYRKLSAKSKDNARRALDLLITDRGSVLYDDCWAETLQFPAVYEGDLREWLKNEEDKGLIRIEGRKRPNELLKRNSNHVIVRPEPK